MKNQMLFALCVLLLCVIVLMVVMLTVLDAIEDMQGRLEELSRASRPAAAHQFVPAVSTVSRLPVLAYAQQAGGLALAAVGLVAAYAASSRAARAASYGARGPL